MQLMNVDEAAAFLGVHRGTVYGWVETGRLPCLRAGTRLRFIREELLAWARRNGEESVSAGRVRAEAGHRCERDGRNA